METNTPRLLTKLKTLVTPWAYSPNNFGEVVQLLTQEQGLVLSAALVLAIAFLFLEHLAVWKQLPCEYDILTSPWVSRGLVVLTVLFAADASSSFIYFVF